MPGRNSTLSLYQIKGECCVAGGFRILVHFGLLSCLGLTFQLSWIIPFISDLCEQCGQKLFSEIQQLSNSCVVSWQTFQNKGTQISDKNERRFIGWGEQPEWNSVAAVSTGCLRCLHFYNCFGKTVLNIFCNSNRLMCMKEHIQESNIKIKMVKWNITTHSLFDFVIVHIDVKLGCQGCSKDT